MDGGWWKADNLKSGGQEPKGAKAAVAPRPDVLTGAGERIGPAPATPKCANATPRRKPEEQTRMWTLMRKRRVSPLLTIAAAAALALVALSAAGQQPSFGPSPLRQPLAVSPAAAASPIPPPPIQPARCSIRFWGPATGWR